MKVSEMAENLIGSEIIKLAGEIREKIAQGQRIYNYTIGDFDSNIFPIPSKLREGIVRAYQHNETNYPPADGILPLRRAVAAFIQREQGLAFGDSEILIAGGARPLIYAIYQALVNPGESVLFPVPSWNNNHYTHLGHAKPILIEAHAENNFMPTAEDIKPHLSQASLIALCSPLNPTGTVFTEDQLLEICKLVCDENIRRGPDKKPLYMMYDQIYSALTYGGVKHVDPVSLMPELRNYTVYVDGISKSLSATGVRVGWSFGPRHIIDRMKSILGHIGAWAPKAEQVATAEFMHDTAAMDEFLSGFKQEVYQRLITFYEGMQSLKADGFPVVAVAPQAAIYMTLQFNLKGFETQDGRVLQSTSDITQFLLNEAGLAIVPFSAFGVSSESTWYRMSVGTTTMADVTESIDALRRALTSLKRP
ncbi:MAG: pyridoxal phosphate-dependent aminotransferase [Flavobacteriales bacterium]